MEEDQTEPPWSARPGLLVVVREWGRIGCIGFGGPPAHISLLRRLCVQEKNWLSERDFEDGIAATNLLPGPSSTQLAIFCAWRLRGAAGAILGGLSFILPGLALILALSALFVTGHPPEWIRGAAAGAGAAIPAVAVQAAAQLLPASRRRVSRSGSHTRWAAYLIAGLGAAVVVGPYLVLVLVLCGLVEVVLRRPTNTHQGAGAKGFVLLAAPSVAVGGLAALAWVALKVGALSYGGGFVIIPLMRADAVQHYHWMTDTQFLNAVVLGQVTPGPLVQTVAVVGYAAAGIGGALLAATIAFAPSFVFILAGARHFDRLRSNHSVQAFLDGAGPAAIGAIGGSAIVLALSLTHLWQLPILLAALVALFGLHRGVVVTLLGAGAIGVVGALAGLPVG